MKTPCRFALLLVFLAAPAWADPPKLLIPSEVPAQPGQWVVIVPDTDAKAITYVGLDGLSAFPSSELRDPRRLVVNAPASGRFRFVAVGTLNDEQTAVPFTVVVAGTPPTPPPAPTPDAFQQALQDAFGVEAATPKLTQVRTLATFYRTAARTTVNDPRLLTTGDLDHALKLGVKLIGLPPGALSGLVQVIASDMTRALGDPIASPKPLDAATRAAAAAELNRIASALEGIK